MDALNQQRYARLVGDKRLGQSWSLSQRVKNDAIFLTARLALWATRRLSDERRRRAGRSLGQIGARVLRSRRNRAQERLVAAFGPHPPVTVEEVFATLGEDLANTISLLGTERASEQMPLAPGARQVLDAAVGEGQGVVFCTAHLGPIDVMAASVAEQGYDVVTLARESYDPRFTQLYDAMRQRRGVDTIYRGRAGMETSVIRALRKGRIVGFPMELAGRGMATRSVRFLGESAPMPVGPARLALRFQAPVVVGTPTAYLAGLQTTVERVMVAEGCAEQGESALMKVIAEALEARILALPAHWVWMHGV